MRLNAFLAACGVTSRRKAEAVILEGRVRVNGRIVLLPYLEVDPEKDDVQCDGRRAVPSTHIEIQSKVGEAGLEIIDARITYLAYATEIAAAMLQRQQGGGDC